MIPDFRGDGTLPPGTHRAEWQEFFDRFGTTLRRRQLLSGLKDVASNLKNAGCPTIYVDGSFVTAKANPGDFDACWDVTGVVAELLDPVLLIFDSGCATQKAKYGGELYPAQLPEGRSGRTFLEFFQLDRETDSPKGIVVLNLDDISFED